MRRFWKCCGLTLTILVVVGTASFGHPQPAQAQEEVPVSITLTGWGWCVAYREIGSVVANLTGSRIARDNATEIEDIYLAGTLTFNISDRSDLFELELRGTKVRSLFFLKQVSGGEIPLIAEFEGSWLGETDYVACEGRIAVPAPNHIAKPYLFVLRTEGVEVPERDSGGWVGNMEFVVQKLTGAFDAVADEISSGGSLIKEALGDLLAKAAVIARDLRGLGIPYLT
jgi:hypothetical protein